MKNLLTFLLLSAFLFHFSPVEAKSYTSPVSTTTIVNVSNTEIGEPEDASPCCAALGALVASVLEGMGLYDSEESTMIGGLVAIICTEAGIC